MEFHDMDNPINGGLMGFNGISWVFYIDFYCHDLKDHHWKLPIFDGE